MRQYNINNNINFILKHRLDHKISTCFNINKILYKPTKSITAITQCKNLIYFYRNSKSNPHATDERQYMKKTTLRRTKRQFNFSSITQHRKNRKIEGFPFYFLSIFTSHPCVCASHDCSKIFTSALLGPF